MKKRRMNISAPVLAAVLCSTCIAAPSFSRTSKAPTVRELVELSDLSGLAVSPNGQLIAFRQETASVERNSYVTTWYIQRIEDASQPHSVAYGGTPLRHFGGTVLNEPPQWSPDSRWIYFRAMIDGEIQIWRASANGERTERVTADPADVESFWLDAEGRQLTYQVGASREDVKQAEREVYDHGILIDGTVPVGQGLIGSAIYNGQPMTERFTGRWMDRKGLLADRPRQYRSVDLATFSVRESSNPHPVIPFPEAIPAADRPSAVRSASTGSVVYLDRSAPKPKLRILDAAGRTQFWRCSHRLCDGSDVEGFAWRPGKPEVIITLRGQRPSAHSLYVWNIGTNKSVRLVDSDGLLSGDALGYRSSCAIAPRNAVCVTASADIPPRLELIDLETGRRSVLFDPNRILAGPGPITSEYLEWQDEQGTKFTGHLLLPASLKSGPLPMFINYYACAGYLRGALGEEWPMAAMANAGIAALCINQVDQRPTRQADLEAALSGVRSIIIKLSRRGIVDRNRVGMGGLSFGGEVATYIAVNSDLLSAVSVTAVSATENWYYSRALMPNFAKTVRSTWGLGLPEETPEQWRKLSANYHIERIRMPFLLQPPEQEYSSLIEFYARMTLKGNPVEMHVFPNETHIKFQPRHKIAAYERNLDWFRFWLQGYEDPAPAKRSQFGRWRQLRERRDVRADGSPAGD